jgi:hypothetical protein
MRWLPAERAKFTALGGTVLGTALLEAIALFIAMGIVLDRYNVLILLPALIWGVFALNLDRWLVSIVIGPSALRAFLQMLPRLVLAFAFGVVVAEPVILLIFESSIQHQAAALGITEESIGLLHQFSILDDLAADSTFLAVSIWAIRVVFVVITSLPVLVRIIGGRTSYDHLVETQIQYALEIRQQIGEEVTQEQVDRLVTELLATQAELHIAREELARERRQLA